MNDNNVPSDCIKGGSDANPTTPSANTVEAGTAIAANGAKKRKKQENPLKKVPGMSTGRWTEDEHRAFLIGMQRHGRDWNRIATECLASRTSAQVRSHAQKYLTKLAKEQFAEEQQRRVRDQTAAFLVRQETSSASDDPTATSTSMIVQRIIESPGTVEQEVEDVLQKLHERYRLLQRRLSERRERSEALVVDPRADNATEISFEEQDGISQKSLDASQNMDVDADSVNQDGFEILSSESVNQSEEEKEELIAVQVLRSGLLLAQRPHGGLHEGMQDEYSYYHDDPIDEEATTETQLTSVENSSALSQNAFDEMQDTSLSPIVTGMGKVSSTVSFESNQDHIANGY